MALTSEELNEEYLAALEDAGFQPEQVRVYVSQQIGTGSGPGAVWHPPGDELVVDDQFPDAGRLADANDPKHIDLHRIVVPADPPDRATFAALLRHELEHARQHDELGMPVFELQRLIEHQVLPRRAGGIPRSSGLVNEIPTEIDCNAASSVYVMRRFSSDDVAALRKSDHFKLAASLVGPEPYDTLPARMVAHAFIHRSCLEAYAAENGTTAGQLLEREMPGAGRLWDRLASPLAD